MCVAMGKEANMPFSEKKKNRLEALERRLLSPVALDTNISAVPSASCEGGDSTYERLCQSVFTGPLGPQLQLHGEKASDLVVDNLLRDLLESNTKIIKDVEGTIEQKLLDKVVLLENSMPHGRGAGKGRSKAHQRSLGKRSYKHLSSRQHRKLGSFAIAEKYQKYDLYIELNELWTDYTKRLLKDCSDMMIQSRLLAADLHGAIMEVLDSKIVSFIGVQGIMIRETENTFGIITSNDQLKVIPKSGSIFLLQLENLRVMLIGNNLHSRSLLPSSRAQKLKATVEL
ncbi:hypothetical protein O6H91_03G045500 [Diphasiastrum complanatum]|uniref:Uncharacterized protein n=1 Tax=Diphasiastrum complanatum TaxID=34168 RepID=A0ACC2E693_DIPCM|nr:hypothetical protein O6H91_03G045500 [Diphasiastrum complanatum]